MSQHSNVPVKINPSVQQKKCKLLDYFLSLTEVSRLKSRDSVDYRCYDGKFRLAKVSKREEDFVKISHKIAIYYYTSYINIKQSYQTLAQPNSFSKMGSVKLDYIKLGDKILFNCAVCDKVSFNGWKEATIINIDQFGSGQVLLKYSVNGKYFEYWTHLDNENEVREFDSKNALKSLLVSNDLRVVFDVICKKNGIESIKALNKFLSNVHPKKILKNNKSKTNGLDISQIIKLYELIKPQRKYLKC